MKPRGSITKPEPAPSTGTASMKKSYSVALVRMLATAGEAWRYTRTLMDSSSVRMPSRCATVVGAGAPDSDGLGGGTAPTLIGWCGPKRAPTQYAAKRTTSAPRITRARVAEFTVDIEMVLPSQDCCTIIRKSVEQVIFLGQGKAQAPGFEFLVEKRV